MSRRRRYPRLDSTTPYKNKRVAQCKACEAETRATAFVWVQYTYMRGDDERYDVCERHRQMAESNFDQFMAHLFDAYKKRRDEQEETPDGRD